MTQVGGDVVISGSGTLITPTLTPDGVVSPAIALSPDQSYVIIGNNINNVGFAQYYGGVFAKFPPFGKGGGIYATLSSGDTIGISRDFLLNPIGYVSGTSLLTTATFANATFTSLGLTPGTYTYAYGSGPKADTFIIQVGAVPCRPRLPCSVPA